jgi:4-hydroxybenzoate polyprenyltransferase
MKRVTYWPQLFLGLTFNWGALHGLGGGRPARSTARRSLLYAGGIAWTLGYDTIYAHQDKEDDALIGVKSTALRFGARASAGSAASPTPGGRCSGRRWPPPASAWPGWLALAAGALHLGWQIASSRLDEPADCLRKFRSNRWLGWILFCRHRRARGFGRHGRPWRQPGSQPSSAPAPRWRRRRSSRRCGCTSRAR